MESLLNTIPASLACILFVAICIALYVAGLILFRRQLKKETLRPNHDVNGIMFGLIGLLFSLVLAFVIIAVWQEYDEITRDVAKEAGKVNGIMVHCKELPDSLGNKIHAAAINYATVVVKEEWTSMEQGKVNNLTDEALQSISKETFPSEVASEKEQNVLRLMRDDLNDISDLRQERLTRNHSHIPDLVWLVLIAGGLITILYSYFFVIEPLWLQAIMGTFLTGMIAMCVFLVFMLDHPFLGSSGISSEPFQQVIRNGH